MVKTASCVIIGAGIAGTSTAYFLVSKGMKDVVLVDKGSVASGITGYTAGYAFLHHDNPWKVQLSAKGLEMYTNWKDLIGGECSWHQVGYLFMVSPEESSRLHGHVETIRQMGVGDVMETLGPEDVKVNWPFYNVEGIAAASYEPNAGFADGSDAANSLARRFRDMGGRLMQGAEVSSIKVEGGWASGVELADGEAISAPTVVVAAGAWSGKVASTAGIKLPVEPGPVSAGIVVRPPETQDLTTVVDYSTGNWFRPDVGNSTLVGVPERQISVDSLMTEHFPQSVGYQAQTRASERLTYRIPAMKDAYWKRTYAAVDATTEDHMPLIGPVPQVEGLYINTGFTYYGFMQGPAAGQCLAEIILEGQPSTLDIQALRPTRFEEEKPISGPDDYYFFNGPWVEQKFGPD
ncbi:MAG: NAD(P)/FAD-dependent oxidoreductase [Dehalococcoidia bacterium]